MKIDPKSVQIQLCDFYELPYCIRKDAPIAQEDFPKHFHKLEIWFSDDFIFSKTPNYKITLMLDVPNEKGYGIKVFTSDNGKIGKFFMPDELKGDIKNYLLDKTILVLKEFYRNVQKTYEALFEDLRNG